MKIGLQGSKNFSDYSVFMRAMNRALRQMPEGDKSVILYAVGGVRLNALALGFSNASEDGFAGRGMSIEFRQRPSSWLENNMSELDYFAYFKLPGERTSRLVDVADNLGVNAQIYEYK